MTSTITVNVTEEVARDFRKKAYQLYGKKKGSLGRAFTEAMNKWSNQKDYFDTCMNLLQKGVNMGKLGYKSREELHDRD